MIETLSSFFDQTALRQGEKEAILFLKKGRIESRVTYFSLKRVSDRVASGLREMGLEKGDRVILFIPKSIETVMLHLGVQKAGGISVILNPGFKKDEVSYFLKDTAAKIALVGKKEEAFIRSLDANRLILPVDTESPFSEEKLFPSTSPRTSLLRGNLNDPAILIYTSGTTGQPKGAILTQQNLIQDARNIIQIWEISERDTLCHALPLFHIHGLCFALHTSLIAGSKIVMLDEFSSEHVNDILSHQEGELACTIFMGVPTMYAKMMDSLEKGTQDFSHIRLLASGSAPLPPREFERIKNAYGKEPVEREGMSETGMNFSNPLRAKKKPGSIGLPLPSVEVRIVDPESFRDLDTGEVGEIWLRGPNVTPGYWGKPQETEVAFVKEWFRTGDLGKKDGEGYYYITDRLKHIIISGGENISPKEVESILDRFPGISESCVVGVPDKKWGEKVVAGIVLKPGVTLAIDKIKKFCKEHLLDWKCPKEIIFLKELPRNRMGKIMKEDVVRQFASSNRREGYPYDQRMSESALIRASWEDEYSISFYEVDTKNEVFLPVLWSFMQETAWHHADHLRLGYSDLMAQQYFWVLSRLSVQMEEYPRWGDRIRVKTWLTGIGRLFALRHFSVADLAGKILGTAKSAWLVLDLKGRKPQKIEPLFKHLRHLIDPLLPAEEPEKLPARVQPESKRVYEVRYSDIDIHHHVNNIKYIEWVLDSYPFAMNQTHQVHRFEINFLTECSHGDEISIHAEPLKGSPPAFLHSVFRKNDGRELCRARVSWKRIDSHGTD